MTGLIQLIIYIVIFAVAAYGLYWVCVKFQMPQPVLWIVGALLLIIVLLFLAKSLGVPGLPAGFLCDEGGRSAAPWIVARRR